MDMSGSMLKLPGVLNHALETAFVRLGVPAHDKLTYISFNDTVHSCQVRRDELRNLPSHGSSNTNMAGVFPALVKLYRSLGSDKDVRIVLFSDGELSDTNDAIRAAVLASEQLGPRTGITDVVIARINSSSYANPDTRAMSLVASVFGTSGEVALTTIDNNDNLCTATESFITQGFQSSQQATCILSGTNLARFPGEPGVTRLTVNAGKDVWVLVDDITNLRVNGHLLDVEVRDLKSASELEKFVNAAASKIRTDLVANLKRDQLDKAFEFFDKVEEQLDRAAKTASPEKASAKLADRLANLRNKLRKTEKTGVTRLLELRNLDNIHQLNQSQIAEFMTGNVQIGKATARRAMKNDGSPVNIFDQCATEVEKLASLCSTLQSCDDKDKSFVGQEGPSAYLTSAQALVGLNPSLKQILEVVGPVGVCIGMEGGQYPDPWEAKVKFVDCTYFVSTADLVSCMVNQQDLLYPSTTERVTGVVGMSFLNKEAFKLFTTTCPTLLKALASMFMRNGNIACVPGDVAALVAAVHLRLVLQQGLTNPATQAAKRVMRDLRNQLVGLLGTTSGSIGAQVAEHLNSDDFSAYCTGANHYGVGCLRPFSVLASHPRCAELRKDRVKTAKIFRFFIVRAAYEDRRKYDKFNQDGNGGGGGGGAAGEEGGAASSDGEGGGGGAASPVGRGASRTDELLYLLGIDLTKFDEEYPDESLDLDSAPVGTFKVDLEEAQRRARSLSWMPDLNEYIVMQRFVDNLNGEPDSTLGVPVDEVRLVAALVALKCRQQSDMDKTKFNLTADPGAAEELAQRLANEVYAEHVKDRKDEKLKKEAEAKRQAILALALAASSPETFDLDFVGRLDEVGMTSLSAPGVAEFLERLAAHDWPLKQPKIMTLLTGRNPRGEIVWANGNVCALIPAVFRKFFKEDATNTLLARVKSCRKLQGHVYSPGRTGTNRHGYNTDHRKLGDMNYATLEEFRNARPEAAAEWLKRRVQERLVKEHKKNRCWYGYRTLDEMKEADPEAYYAKAMERTLVALTGQLLCRPKKIQKDTD
jgi:uncharacterized membrane protein YgcG